MSESLEELSDRELDALVAERVMGQKCGVQPGGLVYVVPRYSTDLRDAFSIVAKVRRSIVVLFLPREGSDPTASDLWQVELTNYGPGPEAYCVVDKSPARAICLAALAAQGAK